ncbi:MAG TPA: FAD-dependent oxidoreductase, partial [Alphaproteobacteria bacterium]|nr:FAD-dependent oxidoreductase [Alphaproteobacteria bacterium]
MSTHTTDVVVIGSGINGASCAYHLASRGLDVTVLEREAAPAMGSTGRSAAGVRVQFTTEANIRLSLYSLPAYREFRERHGRDVGYRPIGYLLLVPESRWELHARSVELQKRLGAPVEVLDPEEARRFVDFDPTGLAGATYGPWDGVIDPHMATLAWVEMAKELGAEFRMRTPVTSLEAGPSGWTVRSGVDRWTCGWVVNVAGAWSGEVGRLAGLAVPVGPKRIQIFLSGPVSDERTYPLTIDLATGVSGAGRSPKESMLYAEVAEGYHAYNIARHRHMAEFDQEFSKVANRPVKCSFTAHLLPQNRGILATIYVRGDAQAIHAALGKR